MTARDDVLARIAVALGADAGGRPETDRPSGYRIAGGLDGPAVVARFVERAGDYGAEIVEVPAGGVASAVTAACARRGARRLAVPPDLPAGWRPTGIETTDDLGGGYDDLDAADGALTGCALAIADTGTIVLDAGPAQGRRALTLVPDWHVCVVTADHVVETVPEAVAALSGAARAGRPITLVSGPSATSDIELSRVQGVHGPRSLTILLVAPHA